jgi:hypothetical protein
LSFNNFKEYSFDYPEPGFGDSQYVGNSFNMRQLSLKLHIRMVPALNNQWTQVKGSNYVSYRVLLVSPNSIDGIQDNHIASGFHDTADMFQNLPSDWDFQTPFTFPGMITHNDHVTGAPPFICSTQFGINHLLIDIKSIRILLPLLI